MQGLNIDEREQICRKCPIFNPCYSFWYRNVCQSTATGKSGIPYTRNAFGECTTV